MKKTLKIAVFICILVALCSVVFCACGSGDQGGFSPNTNTGSNVSTNTSNQNTTETPLQKEHKEIGTRLENINYDDTYSELYSVFSDAIAHRKECGCEPIFKTLFNYMLLGEWKDESGAYIKFTYVFTDYNDKNGTPWYSTNLQTSKEADKNYYYYFDYKNDNLIIGYTDVASGEKTENFVLTFNENAISLESKIENKTYTLLGNFEYEKVVKGKAKLAYEHIIGVISTFEAPEKIVITNCYVHYPNNHVLVTIEYENSSGTKVSEQYELTVSNGQYQKNVFPYLASSNVDIDELNQLIKDFLAADAS